MEEKLNELLEKAELKLTEYDRERTDLNHKMRFLIEHKFEKELEWIRFKRESMCEIFEDYRDTVTEIREMLNKWQS